MNPERWQRIKEIVYEAVELRAHDREAYLEQACNGDTTLRQEVDALVAASDQAGTFLDPIASPRGPADIDLAGSMIGPYRLTAEIGRDQRAYECLPDCRRRDPGVRRLRSGQSSGMKSSDIRGTAQKLPVTTVDERIANCRSAH
jgi:hypothetical protein